jgi:hypothetical protein
MQVSATIRTQEVRFRGTDVYTQTGATFDIQYQIRCVNAVSPQPFAISGSTNLFPATGVQVSLPSNIVLHQVAQCSVQFFFGNNIAGTGFSGMREMLLNWNAPPVGGAITGGGLAFSHYVFSGVGVPNTKCPVDRQCQTGSYSYEEITSSTNPIALDRYVETSCIITPGFLKCGPGALAALAKKSGVSPEIVAAVQSPDPAVAAAAAAQIRAMGISCCGG